MKINIQDHESAALGVLSKLLLADEYLVRKGKKFIRVKNLRYLKTILPSSLSLKIFLKVLMGYQFEIVMLRRRLVIIVPGETIERALHLLMDEIEKRQMRMWGIISKLKRRVKEAETTNHTLHALLNRNALHKEHISRI